MLQLKNNIVDLNRQIMRINQTLDILKKGDLQYYIQKKNLANRDLIRIKFKMSLILNSPLLFL